MAEKKLTEDQMRRVDKWREQGISYGNIAKLVESNFDIEITPQTIYRYCRNRGIEVEI